jgi:hypothetical protein
MSERAITPPVHPLDRFSAVDLGIVEESIDIVESMTQSELEKSQQDATKTLLRGGDISGVERVVAIQHVHHLASKLGMELIAVERNNG